MNIADKNLDELEFLLSQSMNGIHLLFDNQTIARVLKRPTEELNLFSFENLDRIQGLLIDLIQKNSVAAKQCFLDSLDTESYEMLLRTYFQIVDNSLLTVTEDRH